MEGCRVVFETPFGWMGMAGGTGGVQRIFLPVPGKEQAADFLRKEMPSFCDQADFFRNEIAQIEEYFAGKRREFRVLLDFSRATGFQRRVYEILLTIPYGEVRTYGWIARKMGEERALRAVGHPLTH